jgi:hypothetical protein
MLRSNRKRQIASSLAALLAAVTVVAIALLPQFLFVLTLLRHFLARRERWQSGQRGSQDAMTRAMARRAVMKLSGK